MANVITEVQEIIGSTISIREIRAAVLPKRAENCQTYAAELRTIGITLNC